MAADGSDPVELTGFRSGEIFNVEWSTDGARIVISQGEIRREVVLLSDAESSP